MAAVVSSSTLQLSKVAQRYSRLRRRLPQLQLLSASQDDAMHQEESGSTTITRYPQHQKNNHRNYSTIRGKNQPLRYNAASTASHQICIQNCNATHKYQCYSFSTLPSNDSDSESDDCDSEQHPTTTTTTNHSHHHPQHTRLSSIRNVGIFAHVDAGKTTVTERMLALSGIVHDPGSVDTGDTVTDYLPAERERGITIQSAAVGFDWVVPPSSSSSSSSNSNGNDALPTKVSINLIDTPGHVDFSVEVHRSVAVLDGAVLVVDAVAGVQAQTETVWRAIRNTDKSSNCNSSLATTSSSSTTTTESSASDDGGGGQAASKEKKTMHGSHEHEPLPTLMFINKMDREGADFNYAMDTVRTKLRGSNPLAIQLPLYRVGNTNNNNNINNNNNGEENIVAGSLNDSTPPHGTFIGIIDLIHMRAIVYPDDIEDARMEDAVPTVLSLTNNPSIQESNPQLLKVAINGQRELISNLANVDEVMEDLYLLATIEEEDDDEGGMEEYISTSDIQSSLRRSTLERKVMPTLCGAALRGLGVEPVLDCVADYLPCPLDRLPPQLRLLGNTATHQQQHGGKKQQQQNQQQHYTLGHPLNSSTLAFVFKVLHMKGRGGSGDGRVAFARVYSGTLKARDSVRVISPSLVDNNSNSNDKNKKHKYPVERIGGMLELSGGTFGNLPEGSCSSGDVCAMVGLKSVVTGDTLLLTSAASSNDDKKKSTKKNNNNNKSKDMDWKQYMDGVHIAGLTSPRPVLTIRLEANSASEQSRLSSALSLLTVEDPSLVVEETPTTTLLSGLGELHMEIVLDRLRREFGLEVRTGKPAVTYRETVLLEDGEVVETDGLLEYDRTVGGVRMQGAVHLRLRHTTSADDCIPPEDPKVTLSSEAREYFDLDPNISSDESEYKYPSDLRALLSGIRGSLKRGRLGPYPLANLECHVVAVDSEISSQDTLPGAMRAAAANAVTTLLETLVNEDRMLILEPKMNVEISVPTGRVGDVLSDLTGRRGTVDDVAMADEGGGDHVKSMVRAEVPLIEILGYANSLRSLTGGEGAFSAEYKGHAPQDGV